MNAIFSPSFTQPLGSNNFGLSIPLPVSVGRVRRWEDDLEAFELLRQGDPLTLPDHLGQPVSGVTPRWRGPDSIGKYVLSLKVPQF